MNTQRRESEGITRRMALRLTALAAGGLFAGGCARSLPVSAASSLPFVQVTRAPEGALQPQALIDAGGTVHLVYLKGKPSACDVFYARREQGKDGWSVPLRVNSIPGSAIATGTIRGAQIALGKRDRLHVVWNGVGGHGAGSGAPLFYTHLAPGAAAFASQRDLLGSTADLDGGASVAADPLGNVYVAWHAAPSKGAGEGERRVWVARSANEGRTFAPETAVYRDPTGACACCSVKIFADDQGAQHLLYRAATERVNRDMVLITAPAPGAAYTGGKIDPWVINACPMSSESIAAGGGSLYAAWETDGQVRFARIRDGKIAAPHISAPGPAAGRKHPFLAVGKSGQMLLVWDEGTGWQRGGALAWQLYDPQGHPLPAKGVLPDAIPVWGLATAVALPDGRFLIIH